MNSEFEIDGWVDWVLTIVAVVGYESVIFFIVHCSGN